MKLELDHVVYAVPDLDSACADFAAATGCAPIPGGAHPGQGTRNALVSFGADCYLEILAPDPAQAHASKRAAWLRELVQPTLFHWALRTGDIQGVAARLGRAGLQATPSISMTREQPDGPALAWSLMGLPGLGGAWPFFIDWRGCQHPARSAPVVGALAGLRVSSPRCDATMRELCSAPGVELNAGPAALSLRFESRRGAVEWSASSPRGFFE
jgi:hypothetical protein